MLSFTLKHYTSGSVIIQFDDRRQVAQLTYTRKIHKHEADADYDRIITQLKTYGDGAALEEFDRIKLKQAGDKKAEYEKEVRLQAAYEIIGNLDRTAAETVWIDRAIKKLQDLKHVRENIPF